MNWGHVTIAIPTMPSRTRILSELVAQVGEQCTGAQIVTREHPDGGDPRADLPALTQQALLSAADTGWVLFLEDDVWLAPTFGAAALDFLDANKMASVASFFSRSKVDLELFARGQQMRAQTPSSFCMMQAIAVRRATLIGFPEWAPTWYARHPEHTHAADLLLGAWLSKKGERILVRVPSLVQHRAVPSTLGPRSRCRQSETYRLAFGEVPA